MRHVVVEARVPQVRHDGLAGERLERGGAHEMRGGLRHRDPDSRVVLREEPRQFGRFIRRNATGHAEENSWIQALVHEAILLSEVCMSMAGWPLPERPRERFLAHGAASLSDAELFAIVLGPGARGPSALERARGLIARLGRGSRGLSAGPAGPAPRPR